MQSKDGDVECSEMLKYVIAASSRAFFARRTGFVGHHRQQAGSRSSTINDGGGNAFDEPYTI